MRETLNRLIDWFRRDRLEQELAEEMRFHREHAERDAVVAGVAPDDAKWVARRNFGNTTMAAEASRDRWSLPRLDQLQQDVRYALRGLRRSPGFTATAVVTLALGIGANVAMFDVVDRLMFRPYPFLSDPATTHRVYLSASYRGDQSWDWGGQYTRYLDLRRFTTSFSHLAGFTTTYLAIGEGDAKRERRIATVSGSFWSFFDARPVAGRFFTPAEDKTPRGAEVAVLDYNFWKSEYGGRDVIGQRIQLGNIPATIIGVAPEGFNGVFDDTPVVYIPITLYAGSVKSDDKDTYYNKYYWGWMNVMVRRKPGVSTERATADLTQAWRRSWEAERAQGNLTETLDKANPKALAGPMKIAAGPGSGLDSVAGKTALWLTGVAALVLLIACANVANLSLARALRRQREIAVRLALGVSRSRLVGQMLIETLLLGLFAAIAGVVVAQWGGAAIRGMLVTTPQQTGVAVGDWRMIAAIALIVVVTVVFTGMIPAMLSGRGDLAPTLRSSGRGGMLQRSRVRGVLLVTQGALSVVLLIGAALFVRSLRNVQHLRLGFDAEPVLLAAASVRGGDADTAVLSRMQRELVVRAQAVPGVQSAAFASSIPFRSTSSRGFFVAGIDSVRKLGQFTYQTTTPDYFRTFGTRILRGRSFTASDVVGTPPVTVVSQSMARVLWPGKDAIGQCIHIREEKAPCTTVIGISEDIVQQSGQLTDPKRYQYYLPLLQVQSTASNYVILKMTGDPAEHADAVRRALQPLMPGRAYVTVTPMRDVVGRTQRSWKLGANLFVIFGVLALVVAAIGLYGVLAYNVTQRMHELGVRVALGAQAGDILRLVVGQGARFAAAGVVVGSALAFFASKWVEPLLFNQSARDPVVYVAVGILMILVALAASVSPAYRASGADPNAALRSE
jgi:predicted permease